MVSESCNTGDSQSNVSTGQLSSFTCPRVRPYTPEFFNDITNQESDSARLNALYSSAMAPRTTTTAQEFYKDRKSNGKHQFIRQRQQDIGDDCIKEAVCDKGAKFRTIDGSCNNLEFPQWGMAGVPLVRILPAFYSDGKKMMRKSVNGDDLPSARMLHTTLLTAPTIADDVATYAVMSWGQLISHDTARVMDQQPNNGMAQCLCCSTVGTELPPSIRPGNCVPISVPASDPFYSSFRVSCLNFMRSMTTDDKNCIISPAQFICNQLWMSLTETERINLLMMRGYGDRVRSYDEVVHLFNDTFPDRPPISKYTDGAPPHYALQVRALLDRKFRNRWIGHVTHYVDASFLYGSAIKVAQRLRTFSKGLLKSQLVNGSHYPPNLREKSRHCPHSEACYDAGDDRINQNPMLAVLQVMFLRFHNHVAEQLLKLNGHWSDETLYQESRKIVAAVVQHITYTEYLPMIISPNVLEDLKLSSNLGQVLNQYDKFLNPGTFVSFTSAAFRAFHSMIPPDIQLFNDKRSLVKVFNLSDVFFKPDTIQKPGLFNNFVIGLTFQPALKMNEAFAREITELLFKSKQGLGVDLVAADIMRGRDHGLPRYNQVRLSCGLSVASDFNDLMQDMRGEPLLERGWINPVLSSPGDLKWMSSLPVHFAQSEQLLNNTVIPNSGSRHWLLNMRDYLITPRLVETRKAVEILSKLYSSVDDIDLYLGAVLEQAMEGSIMGPTLQCIISEQFRRWKDGDRFFYTFKNSPGAFSPGIVLKLYNLLIYAI
ncbi:chorion peroxidase-like [Homalodisca vitripennis]|uniref:chorion peroxidase-like n=1 Tax=Homalodisca vitripennis TaxID=197043 RepID=UPI001EEB16BC|nr:chorion peroxidase-like [Homalodisca vitripennis]